MMRLIISILLLAIPSLALAGQTNEELLADIQTRAQDIHSISSQFTQEKHLAMFDKILVSEGMFAFQKPASLRWEYTSPFRAGFTIKEDKGIEWDEASGTERDFSLDSSPAMAMVARQIMAWTTFDIPWLQSRYEIIHKQTHPVILELRPRGEVAREFLAHLIVSFAPDNYAISSLELHETDGDFTRIIFKAPQINNTLANETFTSVR